MTMLAAASVGGAADYETQMNKPAIQVLPTAVAAGPDFMIREMKLVPFSRQLILQIAVLACLPGLPLIFLVMPVGELLKLLAGALL